VFARYQPRGHISKQNEPFKQAPCRARCARRDRRATIHARAILNSQFSILL
jgi:hypothetical protein